MKLNVIIKMFSKYFFVILEYIMPKDKNLIIFAGSGGNRYADNAKYLFEYFADRDDFKCYWLTKDRNNIKNIDKKYKSRILFHWSGNALFLFLKAKIVVISHGRGDVHPFYLSSKRKCVINLWHGTPIKKIGFLDQKTYSSYRNLRKYRDEVKNYTYLVSSSEIERYIFASVFKMDIKRIWITGMPRNDTLLKPSQTKLRENLNLNSNSKLVLYAPTFRDDSEQRTSFFPFDDRDFGKLNEFLIKHSIYILIRAHINEQNKAIELAEACKILKEHIIFVDHDKYPDVNELLVDIDILLTDYSGIYFDFLLLDRPIIFLPYDYDEYIQHRGGFILNYLKYTPGPKVNTQSEFLVSLKSCLSNPQKYSEHRLALRNMFHDYLDGQACERIYKKISDLYK